MKQNITKQQWEELNNKEQDFFYKTKLSSKLYQTLKTISKETKLDKEQEKLLKQMDKVEKEMRKEPIIDIGQMIEFLGNDLACFTKFNYKEWCVSLASGLSFEYNDEFKVHSNSKAEELCDALWEAVKYKLNK